MLFHEVAARALVDNGIDTMFGLIGDGNLYLVDDFQRNCGGRFYSVTNESSAVLAASGYTRTTGQISAATVTHGPAFTNTVTSLVEATRERTPLLLVAGDTAMTDKYNLQNVNQRDITLPTGAGFEQVRSADTICEDIAVAVLRAQTERRPIVLNIPIEFQWKEAVFQARSGARSAVNQAIVPSRAVTEDAIGILASAHRPVILAGRGAATEDGRAALIRLSERLGAPLATTLLARDLFRGEPYNLGICGTVSHEVALETINNADCIISFGASLNFFTTAEGSILQGKSVVQVDTDVAALGLYQAVDAVIHADAAATATAMVELLDEAEIKPTGYTSPTLAEALRNRSDWNFTDRSTDSYLDHRAVVLKLEAAFPADRTLVFDGGRFIFNAFPLLHVQQPSDHLQSLYFGSIGLGVATAIGAAAGSGKPTLLVAGDGGFMLGGLAEFNSAVRHNLDIVVVVLNDGAYGAEHIQFRNKELDPALSMFQWPEFAAVADSLGGKGYTVRNHAELDRVLAALPERDRPVLIDVKMDPDNVAGH